MHENQFFLAKHIHLKHFKNKLHKRLLFTTSKFGPKNFDFHAWVKKCHISLSEKLPKWHFLTREWKFLESYKFPAYLECIRRNGLSFGHSDWHPSSVSVNSKPFTEPLFNLKVKRRWPSKDYQARWGLIDPQNKDDSLKDALAKARKKVNYLIQI